jgi:hypothetical protein
MQADLAIALRYRRGDVTLVKVLSPKSHLPRAIFQMDTGSNM